MATTWAEVVGAALTVIDDERASEQLTVSPAQFYRRMSAYVNFALPMLNRPPELLKHLKNGMTQPEFDEAEWTSTETSTGEETQVETGFTGYDLCSVVMRIPDGAAGGVIYAPYSDFTYDAETGIVTFPVQQSAGVEYMIDFYNDGTFPTLTDSQMRLFALAIAVVWDERFERTWLSITPKIKDSTFDVGNEANYMEKSSQRLQRNIAAFNDRLRHYEQDCAYLNVVKMNIPIGLI